MEQAASVAAAHLHLGAPHSVVDFSINENPYSSTYRIVVAGAQGDTRVVYAKQPEGAATRGAVHRDRLTAELEILQRLWTALPRCGPLQVVRPIAYLDSETALVTEEAVGPTLQDALGKWGTWWRFPLEGRRLVGWCDLAGQWLRRFHELTDLGSGSVDAKAELDYCRLRISALERDCPAHFTSTLASRVDSLLERLLAEIDSRGTQLTGRHNDFAPHNMIVSENCLSVLDFSMYDTGPALFDFCNFWHQLQQMAPSPFYRVADVRVMQQAFVTAYGAADFESAPAFVLARARYSLNRLLSLAGSGRFRWPVSHERRQFGRIRAWLDSACSGHAPG